jgi:tRNA G18 (ribose-2'-O)-methylase SpoU
MLTVHRLRSLEHAALQPYRTLRRPRDHWHQGVFVAEGEKVVRRLLDSTLRVRSLLLSPDWLEKMRPQLEQRSPETVEVYVADRTLLQEIVGHHFHQAIMALAEVPPEPSLELLPSPHLLVALDALHHAENVGVAVRNAAGLGANGVIVGETSASPYLRRSVRNSMGAVFRLSISHPASLETMLPELAATRGTRLIAADVAGTTLLEEADFGGNLCVILGNEQQRVSPHLLSLCSLRVRIPMDRGIDSLNVGSALAVMLCAIRRNRAL